jgi:hypothetical protein
VNVSITVTWEDGQVTRYTIRGLPYLPRDELVEMLERDLASYVDDAELPDDAAGGAMAWIAVQVTRMRPEGAREVN